MMKIVVCIKQVVDVTFPFVLDQQTLAPMPEDVFHKVNPADLCAMEAALTLKRAAGGQVFVLSYGPLAVEKALKECLAMGADQALRVWQEGLTTDSQAKAFVLAKAVAALLPDLVLCGARSLDQGSGETPAALAEYLGFAQVTGAMRLEIASSGGKAMVEKKWEKGRRETIECPLPAVISLEPGALKPRYASLPGLLSAYRAEVALLDGERLSMDMSEQRTFDALRRQVRVAIPRPRPKKTFSLESGLTAEQRMEMMMSGGLQKAKSDLLEGSAQDLAKQLSGILQQRLDKP